MSAEQRAEVEIRRAPKYLGFALTGVILGVIVGIALGLAFGEIVPMVVIYLAVGFGALGIIAALLFDAFYRARGRTLPATKITE